MKVNRLAELLSIFKSPRRMASIDIAKLFHYTRNNKKENIVSEDKITFKLSRVDEFLDKNEGFLILEPYYHACGYLYEEGMIDEDFFEILTSVRQKDIFDGFSGTWVLCFSKNANSDFMKRRYAANDGWILGISFNRLSDVCFEFPEEYGIVDLYEVSYSFKQIFRLMKTVLKKYYEFCKKESTADYLVKQDVVEWLCSYSLAYKSADYKPEEEVRLVCKFATGFISWGDVESGVRFETSIDGYAPSVKIILDKKWLIYISQNLDWCFDTKLNKAVITGNEIRKVFIKSGQGR